MTDLLRRATSYQKRVAPLLAVAVAGGLLMLPVAAWLDLRGLSERMLRLQANETGRIIDVMRTVGETNGVGGPAAMEPEVRFS